MPEKKFDKLSEKELTKMCIDCGSKCCKYLALEIDYPDCPDEYEKVRWYLIHENSWVFIDDDKWYLLINNKCRFLGDDGLCNYYDRRPEICREHNQKDCESDSAIFYDELFKSVEEFEKFLEENGEKYWEN